MSERGFVAAAGRLLPCALLSCAPPGGIPLSQPKAVPHPAGRPRIAPLACPQVPNAALLLPPFRWIRRGKKTAGFELCFEFRWRAALGGGGGGAAVTGTAK